MSQISHSRRRRLRPCGHALPLLSLELTQSTPWPPTWTRHGATSSAAKNNRMSRADYITPPRIASSEPIPAPIDSVWIIGMFCPRSLSSLGSRTIGIMPSRIDPDVEARAADVAADRMFARAHELADVMAAEHAADGAGGIRIRRAPRGADRHGAAVGEEGRHLAVEALGARPRPRPAGSGCRVRLARVCLRDDAGESGVFLVGRRDRRGRGRSGILFVDLADRFRCRLLVRRVHVGEKEHHGDHLGVLGR